MTDKQDNINIRIMKIKIKSIIFSAAVATAAMAVQSCSLDEENPGGFTMEALAKQSVESYRTILNNSYFGMERAFYGAKSFMELTEGDTDLWTYRANISSSYTDWFWFYAGSSPSLTYTNDYWNNIYDGIGSCNLAIKLADVAPFKTEAERNAAVAEARFMRAVYYYNAVELFGGVVMITEVQEGMDFAPVRTEPLTIYKKVIIPDLEFAAQWLDKGTDATTTVPTKKSALGMLAKACLQTYEYGTSEYLQKALETARTLIADCEGGGSQYGAYMYPTFDQVFAEANNKENKEALWKHSLYAGENGHGSSNGNYKLNQNDEKFLCCLSQFGARVDDQETRLTWEGSAEGVFMPTQHLLSLFVQDDGTLDPRFKASFMTQWNANREFTWDDDTRANYSKDASVVGQKLAKGDLAIRIAMPQDDDYEALVAQKATLPYLLVDYNDVYSDAGRNVKMEHNGGVNLFRYFYPSLSKHNSSNYYVVNAGKKRNGNLNSTFIMRMSEIYLIAAEADLYLNGGANAAGYINKVRTRAGAKPMTATPTVRDILDERGRELCGEYSRFYDLKRTGMLKDNTYLNETHPDLGRYFKPEYALRPIPSQYTDVISNGAEFQNPGYQK